MRNGYNQLSVYSK